MFHNRMNVSGQRASMRRSASGSGPTRQRLVEALESRTLMSAGSLDLSYGPGGNRTIDLNAADRADAVIHLDGGKFLVVGSTSQFQGNGPPTRVNGFLLEYNSDGSLNKHFGNGGKVLIDMPLGSAPSFHAAAAPGGKILVLEKYDDQQLLMRFTARGTLDGTFGKGGTVDLSADDTFTAIAAGPDGKVVLGAEDTAHATPHPATLTPAPVTPPPGTILPYVVIAPTQASDFLVTRLRSDGTVDSAFGNGGTVETDFGFRDSLAGVAVQRDGKILASGWWGTGGGGSPDHTAIARYDRNGKLDKSFGSGGKISEGDVSSGSIVFTRKGGFLIGTPTAQGPLRLAQYTGRGRLDTHFGVGGEMAVAGSFNKGPLIDLQPNGNIVLAATAATGQSQDVIRLRAGGQVDRTFGNAGITSVSRANFDSLVGAVVTGRRIFLVQNVVDTVNGQQENNIRLTAIQT
jgi:uncharacterized delta-60 repeat protein